MLMITIISMPYFNNVQKKLDKISLIVRENLNGIRVIRAFASQDKEINKFKMLNSASKKRYPSKSRENSSIIKSIYISDC